MARPFLSNCRRIERRWPQRVMRLLLLPLVAGALAACASTHRDSPLARHDTDSAAHAYLLDLRTYLAKPAGEQAAHRRQLQLAAERGNPAAILEYAFALSVDRDDPASLELARELFESLLVSPDPLPAALDVLVRLQLGQVIDRLHRMRTAGDLRDAVYGSTADLKTCLADFEEANAQREDMRRQLAEVRRKLDALTRIEQTVNHGQDEDKVNDNRNNGEEDNAERQPDTARR